MGVADDLTRLDDLRRRGALSGEEFEKAKAAVLAGAQEDRAGLLDEIRSQRELARVDHEWNVLRQRYLVNDRFRNPMVPSLAMGIGVIVIGVAFGGFWTAMAVAITSAFPDFGPFAMAKIAFPAFGAIFILSAIGWGGYCIARARAYQAALRDYQERRGLVKPEPISE